jgi:hypothetical protein
MLSELRMEAETIMPTDITIKGEKAKKGERMTKGSGWRLAITRGKKRVFVGTLLETLNRGKERIAIFSVPK